MVLQCTCGGAVTLTDHNDRGDAWTEYYRCVVCEATGTYQMNLSGEQKTGCLA